MSADGTHVRFAHVAAAGVDLRLLVVTELVVKELVDGVPVPTRALIV